MKKISFFYLATLVIAFDCIHAEMETVMISELYRHGTRLPYNNVFDSEYFKEGGKLNIAP